MYEAAHCSDGGILKRELPAYGISFGMDRLDGRFFWAALVLEFGKKSFLL